MSVSDSWRPYHCRNCGETTRASALPPYCPVCGDTNSMEKDDG